MYKILSISFFTIIVSLAIGFTLMFTLPIYHDYADLKYGLAYKYRETRKDEKLWFSEKGCRKGEIDFTVVVPIISMLYLSICNYLTIGALGISFSFEKSLKNWIALRIILMLRSFGYILLLITPIILSLNSAIWKNLANYEKECVTYVNRLIPLMVTSFIYPLFEIIIYRYETIWFEYIIEEIKEPVKDMDIVVSHSSGQFIRIFVPNPYQETQCSICLEILKGDIICRPCGHPFHKKCDSDWKKTRSGDVCPLCRNTLV